MAGPEGDRLIRVDMTTQTVSLDPFPDEWKLLGGRGLSAKILLNECSNDDFVFRRDSRIRLPIERAFCATRSGIPILAPEIVLLYKSKRAHTEKDARDFSNLVGSLDPARSRWLSRSLRLVDATHAWLAELARELGE